VARVTSSVGDPGMGHLPLGLDAEPPGPPSWLVAKLVRWHGTKRRPAVTLQDIFQEASCLIGARR
jgi:hypothetical protein